VTLGALMLSNPPGTQARGVQESEWMETLRRPAFYLIWPMFFSGALAGLTVIGIMKDFAGEQLVAAQTAAGTVLDTKAREALLLQGAAAVGWLAIFNAIGRIAWGLLSDRIGRTATFVAMFAFQAVMLFVLPQMRTEVAIGVAASIIGFNFGGNFALFPSATADLFGAKNLGANYGLVFTSYGIAGVVGIVAGNTAKVITGSYAAAFALAGGLCILSVVLAVALHMALKKMKTSAAA
jgi:OFA family oxalate/formate antiporter-like MFS transporter